MPDEKIERKKTTLIHKEGALHHGRCSRMNVFGALAKDKNRIRTTSEDCAHDQHARAAAVLEIRDKRLIIHPPLVPPSKQRRKKCGDVNLIDRRVEADPGITLGECARVVRDVLWPIGVLKI